MLILAALASGTETALTSVGRLRVRYLAEQGDTGQLGIGAAFREGGGEIYRAAKT